MQLWPLPAAFALITLLRPPTDRKAGKQSNEMRLRDTMLANELGPHGELRRAEETAALVRDKWAIDLETWVDEVELEGLTQQPDGSIELLVAEAGLDRSLWMAQFVRSQLDRDLPVLLLDAGRWSVLDTNRKPLSWNRFVEHHLREIGIRLDRPDAETDSKEIIRRCTVVLCGIDLLRAEAEEMATRLLTEVSDAVDNGPTPDRMVVLADCESAEWIQGRTQRMWSKATTLEQPNVPTIRRRLAAVDDPILDEVLLDPVLCSVLANSSWVAALAGLARHSETRDVVTRNLQQPDSPKDGPTDADTSRHRQDVRLMAAVATAWATERSPTGRPSDGRALVVLDRTAKKSTGQGLWRTDLLVNRRTATAERLSGQLVIGAAAAMAAVVVTMVWLRYGVAPVYEHLMSRAERVAAIPTPTFSQIGLLLAVAVFSAAASEWMDPVPTFTRWAPHRRTVPVALAVGLFVVFTFQPLLPHLVYRLIAAALIVATAATMSSRSSDAAGSPQGQARRQLAVAIIGGVAIGTLLMPTAVMASAFAAVLVSIGQLVWDPWQIHQVLVDRAPLIAALSMGVSHVFVLGLVAKTDMFARLVTGLVSGVSGSGWRPTRFADRAVESGYLSRSATGWTPTDQAMVQYAQLADATPSVVNQSGRSHRGKWSGVVQRELLVAAALTGLALLTALQWPTVRPESWTPFQDRFALPTAASEPDVGASVADDQSTKLEEDVEGDVESDAEIKRDGEHNSGEQQGSLPDDIETCRPLPAQPDVIGQEKPEAIDVNNDGQSELLVHQSTGANTLTFILYGHLGDCSWTELGAFSRGGGVGYFSDICWAENGAGLWQITGWAIETSEEAPKWDVTMSHHQLWPGLNLRETTRRSIVIAYDDRSTICGRPIDRHEG